MKPTVLNKYKLRNLQRDILREYVGRPTIWGNPFKIGVHGTREECVAKYEEYLLSTPSLLGRLPELKGKDLVCFCAPLPCHADILIKYANPENDNEPIRAIRRDVHGRWRHMGAEGPGRARVPVPADTEWIPVDWAAPRIDL